MGMKSLEEVILEKLKIDDIVIDKEFPIDGTVDDMIEFLKDKAFKYVRCDGAIDKWFNKYKSRCYYYNGENLWFGDTTKGMISSKNPIFMYKTLHNSFSVYYCDDKGNVCGIIYAAIANLKENKKKFLQELNKRFGWQ